MSYKFLYTVLVMCLTFSTFPAHAEYYVRNVPYNYSCGGGCSLEEQRWGNYPTQHRHYTRSCKKHAYHRQHHYKPHYYKHRYAKRSYYQISVTRLACNSCSCGACETVYVEPAPCSVCDMRPSYTTNQPSYYCGSCDRYRRVYEPGYQSYSPSLDQSTSDDVITSY